MTGASKLPRRGAASKRPGRNPFGAAVLPALTAVACVVTLAVGPGREIAARLADPLGAVVEAVRPGLMAAGALAAQPASGVAQAATSPKPSLPVAAAAGEPEVHLPVAAYLAAIAPAAGPMPPGGSTMENGLAVDVLQSMAEELRRRGRDLDARERAIGARAELMVTTERQLSAQIGKLEVLKAELEASLDQVNKDEEARLVQLVKVYEAMKAKKAAVVFDGMELPLLLRIVRRMRDAKVAAIVEEMAPETAHRLTTELAQPVVLPVVD